jgi:hypothetical protein
MGQTARARRALDMHGRWNGLNGVSGVDTERVATEFLFLARAKRLVFGVTFGKEAQNASWASYFRHMITPCDAAAVRMQLYNH